MFSMFESPVCVIRVSGISWNNTSLKRILIIKKTYIPDSGNLNLPWYSWYMHLKRCFILKLSLGPIYSFRRCILYNYVDSPLLTPCWEMRFFFSPENCLIRESWLSVINELIIWQFLLRVDRRKNDQESVSGIRYKNKNQGHLFSFCLGYMLWFSICSESVAFRYFSSVTNTLLISLFYSRE